MDVSPPLQLLPGWGKLYQGAAADVGIFDLEPGLWVVCMNQGEVDDALVDRVHVKGLSALAIQDSPDAVFEDDEVFAHVEQDVAWLSRGRPLLRHCGAGVSRASYGNLATIMHARKLSYDGALTLLRTVRPQASPNAGFEAHLRRLERQLMGVALP